MFKTEYIKQFYAPVEMPGGWMFKHAETIKMIDHYYYGKFLTGNKDGKHRKFFYNIVKPVCDIAWKFIDLDTKDIILYPTKENQEIQVAMMQKRLKQWMKEEGIGELLNDIGHDYPKYGSVVIKKAKGKWHLTPIQNLRMDPSAYSLDRSDFVYEVHIYSKAEVEGMDWENKEELLTRGEGPYVVYECYHKTTDGWEFYLYGDPLAANKEGNIIRPAESTINDESHEYLPAILLAEGEVSELPYRELHFEKVPGRWLGYGYVEYLEDNQIATNETENLERKGLHYKALHVWQTKDGNMKGKNVYDSDNGDILSLDSELLLLPKDNTDLSAYNNTRSYWDRNTERKTFTTDITTGASLPSRTPLGVANLQATLATSYFELKREQFGLFIRHWVLYDIIPDFKKDNAKKHTLTYLSSDDDIDTMRKLIVETKVMEATARYAENTGFYPTETMREEAKKRVLRDLEGRRSFLMKAPDHYYDNAHYGLDVLVTGEQTDVAQQSQIRQMALQIYNANPGILSDPVGRNIFFSFLALGGVSPAELGMLKDQTAERPEVPLGMGGSVGQAEAMAGMGARATAV